MHTAVVPDGTDDAGHVGPFGPGVGVGDGDGEPPVADIVKSRRRSPDNDTLCLVVVYPLFVASSVKLPPLSTPRL